MRVSTTLLDENDDAALDEANASRIAWTAPADGFYYVRVAHFDRTYDPRQSTICGNQYHVAIEEITACNTASDTYEPDNLYPQATDIPADGTVQTRTLHMMADKDWATFYALAGQAYTITTSALSPDVDTVLQLYDTNGTSLLDENDDAALDEANASRIAWTAPADGWYYVRVAHFDRTYDPRYSLVCGNQYRLSVETAACTTPADVYEIDNLYTEAADIPTDGSVQTHTFHTVADKDWVRFYALPGQVYTITTFGLAPDVDTVIELYDTDGTSLLLENDDAGMDEGNASHITWVAPSEDWYYVRVTHFNRTYDPRLSAVCNNRYLLSVETTACVVPPDAYEIDNLYTQATEIPTDGTVQTHTFSTVADKDWVRFQAWAGVIYTLTTSHLSPDVDTVIELYDTDGTTLLVENDDASRSESSRIAWNAPADGWYYARITHFDRTFDPRLSSVCGGRYHFSIDQQVLDITKTGTEPENGLQPGDIIDYTIVVWNKMNIPQTNIVITDYIPIQINYVTNSAASTKGTITGPDPLVIDVGTLEARKGVTVTFQATVKENTIGQTILNQAWASSDQQAQPLSSPYVAALVPYRIYLPIVVKPN